ncbi:hypothetical protein OG900_22870 [Streptomyces sp. NBC_00433]
MNTAAEEPSDTAERADEGSAGEQGRADDPGEAGRSAGGATYEGNRQRVSGGGFGFIGTARDIHLHLPPDEADNAIVDPRFREGPYPAEEVEKRLRGFVEPPSYAACRRVLERRVLLLRGGGGTGTGTAAFALLRERFGAGGITGLDPGLDLTRWSPSAPRGYLLQGLSSDAGAALSETALLALSELLGQTGSALVVVVGNGQALPGATAPWQVLHVPPTAYDVAKGHLLSMAQEGRLPGHMLSTALTHLDEPRFADYVGPVQLPVAGVDVAEELREVAIGERLVADAVENLRTGGDKAVQETLTRLRASAEGLAFVAAVALLEHQDRTVIRQYANGLRDRITERAVQRGAVPPPVSDTSPQWDLLGCSFEDRLTEVRAKLLSRRAVRINRTRYWSQPVVFQGRHQAEFLLRRLWWDYDGMSEDIWSALRDMPYQLGIDLAAGRAIGAVLCHATGPKWLQPLYEFASSDDRWRRRLAAYALGEVAQNPDLSGAVRAQLRDWSRLRDVNMRCTVAETCAGSFGLSRPTAALDLLHAILQGSDEELRPRLRSAVTFALNVLLAEESNRPAVLGRLAEWLTEPVGSLRRAYAVHAITALSPTSAAGPFRPTALRLHLAELVVAREEGLLPLVTAALENPASHLAMAEALTVVGSSPDSRQRVCLAELLAALSDASNGRRGVVTFLLSRYRARTAAAIFERTRQ